MAQRVAVLSTDAISVTVTGTEKWQSTIKLKHRELGTAVERAVQRGLLILEGDIKRRVSGSRNPEIAAKHGKTVASGGSDGVVLNKRTGTLHRSIHHRIRKRGIATSGEVGTPVVYAKTHELGLTISYPSRGTSIEFPKRPFVRPSFDQHREGILNGIRKNVEAVFR